MVNKYICGGCETSYDDLFQALRCCEESPVEVSGCCEAEIITITKTDYLPDRSRLWGVEHEVMVCEECRESVE